MQRWPFQDAENKFSEVVEKAISSGPQVVTRSGVDVAVVLAVEQYRELTRPKENIADFLAFPAQGSGIKLERNTSPGRE